MCLMKWELLDGVKMNKPKLKKSEPTTINGPNFESRAKKRKERAECSSAMPLTPQPSEDQGNDECSRLNRNCLWITLSGNYIDDDGCSAPPQ